MYQHALASTQDLSIKAEAAQVVEWQGRAGLQLTNGLALMPFDGRDLSLEVWIGADAGCYPGLVFRAQDERNFELVYAQPHTSGKWDAIQYDPVFNGSNTWQIYHGQSYQKAAAVPTGGWFRLRVDVVGERLAAAIDGQPPLVVERLAHPMRSGQVGIWTYQPAYFSGMRAWGCDRLVESGKMPEADVPTCSLDGWQLDGIGPVSVEPHGVLNLNRWLPVSAGTARLSRHFELREGCSARFSFGFSDALRLAVDGQPVFAGENCFKGFADYPARGYIRPDQQQVLLDLPPGEHELSAELRANEYFGWGIAMSAEGLRWL